MEIEIFPGMVIGILIGFWAGRYGGKVWHDLKGRWKSWRIRREDVPLGFDYRHIRSALERPLPPKTPPTNPPNEGTSGRKDK